MATTDTSEPAVRRIFLWRVLGSIALYVGFVVMSVAWVFNHDPTFKWALFVPLVLSVAVMPRTVPLAVVADENLQPRARMWLSSVRVVYFLVALGILAGLPELVS